MWRVTEDPVNQITFWTSRNEDGVILQWFQENDSWPSQWSTPKAEDTLDSDSGVELNVTVKRISAAFQYMHLSLVSQWRWEVGEASSGRSQDVTTETGSPLSLGKPMRSRMLKLKNAAGALGSSLRDEISRDYRSGAALRSHVSLFLFVCLFLLSWPSSMCHANMLWGKCGLQFRAFRNKIKAFKDH